jgi:CRISPR-associated endonuclease Cas2
MATGATVISLVIYDIPDDKLRAKVADICLDYGLDRIQYSAFLGEMNHNRREELLQKIRRQIGKKRLMYSSSLSAIKMSASEK